MVPLNPDLHLFRPQTVGTLDELLYAEIPDECDTLMIACSDHGIGPDSLIPGGPDRVFILQHLAASVLPDDESKEMGISSGIDFALAYKNIKHVIVCGHSNCGVIRDWLKPSSYDCRGFRSDFLSTTERVIQESYPRVGSERRLDLLIREHVLIQLERLQNNPNIRERLEDGELRLYGVFVEESTSQIFSYDPSVAQYLPVAYSYQE